MKRIEAEAFIASLKSAREKVDDKIASEAIWIFPTMKYDQSLINAGTRINWNGKIKVAAADTWDMEMYNPDNAPTLWEDIEYIDGVRVIPEIITVSKAFHLDELGWWRNEIYKSLIEVNVYTPEQYPQGWEIQLRQE